MTMENSKTRKKVLSILRFSIFVVAVFGSSFAIFSLTDGSAFNSISTGSITMSYTEPYNEISLVDTLPISDDLGMIMNEEDKYFDFSVSTTTLEKTSIPYEVSLTEVPGTENILSNDKVKVFLTKVSDDNEEVLVEPVLVSSLSDSTLKKGALSLYKHTADHNNLITYRLRMWLDASADASLLGNSEYKLLVNVYSSI